MSQLSPPRPADALPTADRRHGPRHAAHAAPRIRSEGGRALLYPLGLFLASRGVLVVLALVVPLGRGKPLGAWFYRLITTGDAGWYLTIARGGYAHLPYHLVHGQENWPFFPLFPVITRWVAEALGSPALWVGFAIANASFLGFLVVLYRWVARDLGARVAFIALSLAAFCPVAPYFVEVRAGPLFLLLSAVCLERAVHRRLGHAVLFGALATLCRPTGVVLVLPYLIACLRLLRDRRSRRAGLAALGAVPAFATGLGVMAWLSRADTGDSLAFLQAQSFWGRQFRPPFAPFVSFVARPSWLSDWGWASPPVALIAALVGLVAALYLWRRRLPAELWLYLLAVVMAGSASTVLFGYSRFVAEAVPLYVAGGVAPRRVAVPLVVFSVAAMIAYTVAWLLGAHWTMG